MNRIILIVIITSLFIPFTSLVNASDDPIHLTAQNPQIIEKQYYNVLSVDVDVNVPNIEMGDKAVVFPVNLRLENQDGEIYNPDEKECRFPSTFQLTGKDGSSGSFTVCFSIDKKFDSFKLYYENDDQKLAFGEIDLKKINSSTLQVVDLSKSTLQDHNVNIETNNEKTSSEKSSRGGCLIATATYGSELAPQVQQLRELRDNFLLKTASGASFMSAFNQFYYSFSPTIADLERENPIFKEMVKLTLIPMINSLSILNYVDMDSEVSVLGYGMSLILLNVGMYFIAPVVVIFKVRKSL